ncbi:MAG: hypothetical protein OXG06_01240 [Gammaproteobacteria bacterium]|nr:hypothetical protein [Gammaproteobacteria bacterium]
MNNVVMGSEEYDHGRSDSGTEDILDVKTDAELHSILSEVRQILPPSDCGDWDEDEARVVGVFSLGSNKELWIGKEYSNADGLGVKGLQKTYEIESLSVSGSPLLGVIKIRLPTPKMDVERACFRKLKGLQVRIINADEQEIFQNNNWKMTITKIKFGVLVKPQGLMKKKEPTGESQVILTTSEGLIGMAIRKSVEHLWALPGSLGLMVLWTIGGWVLRRTPKK